MIKPTDLYARIVEAGEVWAEANAQANQLDEMKKVILSRLKDNFADLSNAAAETKALASVEYEQHILLMVEARKKADIAKVKYQSACEYANLIRTVEATRREEMKHL